MNLKKNNPTTRSRVLKLCRAFLQIEHASVDLRHDLLFSALASNLAVRISEANNTLFVLKSDDGITIEIPIGNPIKTVVVTLKGVKLCYNTL